MSGESAPLRLVRAAMFAAVCVALGAVGHSSMSGTDIPLMGLLGAFGVTGGLAWLGAGRRRGPVGISAALLAVQGVLHLVFSGSQSAHSAHSVDSAHSAHSAHSGHMPTVGPAPEPVQGQAHGHVHPSAPDMDMDMGAAALPHADGAAAAADAAGLADLVGTAGHGGLGMIVAHVLAGLFCALWLARGEAAVFRLTAVLGSAALLAARPLSRALALVRVRASAPRPAPTVRAGRRAAPGRPRRLRGAVHAHAVVRRGPPGRGTHHRATAPGRPARA